MWRLREMDINAFARKHWMVLAIQGAYVDRIRLSVMGGQSMSILRYKERLCTSCGTPFQQLVTQRFRLCKSCRPKRRF